jgi:hypothetical protein
MKKQYIVSIVLFILLSCENTVSEEIFSFEESLNQISIIDYEKRSSQFPGYSYYYLSVEQPIDHTNLSLGTFNQRVRILLQNTKLPVVFITNGYGLRAEQNLELHELTKKLNANQIEVEHRYFGESKPEEIDWSTLTIKQAATDHHKLIKKLKPLITGEWISTGTSKGGMTASYHRRFYPNDLSGTVAYVAPLSLDLWDERFMHYSLSSINPSSIEKYKSYQREALLKIDSLVILLEDWSKKSGYKVNDNKYSTKARLEANIALSWITASSWYENMNQEYLPKKSDNAETYLDYMIGNGDLTFLTTFGLKSQYSYHMQAGMELGNFSAPLEHIKDLLTTDVKDFNLNFPTIKAPNFNKNMMQDIFNWAENDARNIIFIYGKEDIFTGGAYPIENNLEKSTYLFIEPGIHNIRILDLSISAQDQIFNALNNWIIN